MKAQNYTNNIESIINEAFELGMPQIKFEITELARFIQSRIGHEPYNILEIGTKNGGTFHIWNSINKNGLNISIDMDDGGRHGGIGTEKMDKRDLWFQERFENCYFIRGDSHDMKTLDTLASGLMSTFDYRNDVDPYKHEYFDFLFIDGDHTYEGVKMDWEIYSPFVKPGGWIGFHDIQISDHHHSRDVYVGEFWNGLKSSKNHTTIEWIENEKQNWAGIGLIKKV